MRIRCLALTLALLGLLFACTGDDASSRSENIELFHRWDGIKLEPFFETEDLCMSWTLGNEEPIYVNAVTLENDGYFHHSNWFFVDDEHFGGSDGGDGDGIWTCDDRQFDQLSASLLGGVVAAQSTQARAETQAFPQGAVYEIPPHSRIVANLHLLNASDAPQTSGISLELHPLSKDDVEVFLNPMILDYSDLQIPPHANSRFTMRCDFEEANGAPLDFNLYYLLPHYHELGQGARISGISAEGEESMIYEVASEIGDVLSTTLEPAVSTAGMKYFEFSCDFANPRDEVVGSGIGDQEMCIMVGWTDSNFIWAGLATDNTEEVGTNADGVREFQAPCRVGFYPR